MPSNLMFLVCEAHPEAKDALLLSERAQGEVHHEPCLRKVDKWFQTHASCGVDQFALAYERPRAWDQSPPADPVAASVRVAIAESDTEH